jgi:hypothetical protein
MAKGKLRHIRIEPAKNGVLTTVNREPGKSQKGPFMYAQAEERTVHKTAEEAGQHVTKLLKEHGIATVRRSGSVGAKTEKY